MSPYWPNSYLNNRQCIYIIRQTPNEKIYLNFTHLELERHPNCSQNYIEIRDGDTEMAPLINKFCGSILPSAITSSQSSLWIKFKSDISVNISNFRATYEVACGGSLSGEGVIRSPYFTRPLPKGRICEWIISEPEGNIVILNFINFHIYNVTACNSDYVEIRNGGDATSPSLGKYCGNTIPPRIHSRHNSLYIKFRASSTTNLGFMAEYKPFDIGCGAILTSSSGTFMSPNYPMPYYQNMKCYWLLKSSHGNVLEIYFDQFHLESHPSCYFDYLAVYDGNNSNSTMLGKFCGNQIPSTIRSSGNTMYINLNTGYSLNGRGFLAHFKQVCQGIIIANQSQGILESLDYPNNYPPGVYCNWTIQTITGNTLNYSFQALSTKGGDRCKRDHLKLFDGPNTQSTLIGTFCGDSILPSGVTTNSSLHVVFFSDQIDESTGFQMLWKVNGKSY
ncbi:cubilin-like [Notechis scutatus]|uniref:Cubilin-like n=1 Tax=Notechis scutatus TaxID=8663 RepID=A0A6J1VGI1_9SAUR|nr:cubilin-like [Notechis scutatus]